MGGFSQTKNDQDLVDYSGKAFMPTGAAKNIPAGKMDSKGNVILTPAQRAEDAAAERVQKAGGFSLPTTKLNLDSANLYGREASSPASQE